MYKTNIEILLQYGYKLNVFFKNDLYYAVIKNKGSIKAKGFGGTVNDALKSLNENASYYADLIKYFE